MANFRTTADLLDVVLRRCGELTNGTSSYEADALEYINTVYRGIVAGGNEFDVDCGEPWQWAQSANPQVITLKAPYETGSILLVQGSTTGSLSSPPSYSLAGYYLHLGSTKDVYQVLSHTASSTNLTLDHAFIGSSVAADTFRAFKTDYVLPQPVCRLVAPMRVYRDASSVGGNPERGQITELDMNVMDRKYPRMLISGGVPERYAVIGQDSDDILTVRFSHYVLENMRVEIPYISVPADLTDSSSSIPKLPLGFRELLVYGASYYLMLDKSDNRAETELALAKAKLQALIAHNRKSLSLAGGAYGRINPRVARRR